MRLKADADALVAELEGTADAQSSRRHR
jgi:hypothetical protein